MDKLVENLVQVFEEHGIGYEPLIKEFVWDEGLFDKEAEDRIKIIKPYYQAILKKSGNVPVAYRATRKWASKVFNK